MKPKLIQLHDWFVTRGGSEKVASELISIFKIDTVYCLFKDYSSDDTVKTFPQGTTIKTSFLQYLPFLRYYYRYLLPVFPLAIKSLNTEKYDVLISSSHCGIKNVKTNDNQIHICYCHTPIRYAWDLKDNYFKELTVWDKLKNKLRYPILDYIKNWDLRGSDNVDYFIANSRYIANRIEKNYNRKATVIYPPVDTDNFQLELNKEDYYVMANRLVPYKKVDIVIDAFKKMPDKKLIAIGDGPMYNSLCKDLTPNITLIPYPGKEILADYIKKAKAFILASDEDFGITPVEAQATGTPTLAFRKGGALEYTIEGVSGYFFEEQTSESIITSVLLNDKKLSLLNGNRIRENAQRFSYDRFRFEIKNFVSQIIENDK